MRIHPAHRIFMLVAAVSCTPTVYLILFDTCINCGYWIDGASRILFAAFKHEYDRPLLNLSSTIMWASIALFVLWSPMCEFGPRLVRWIKTGK